MVFHFFVFRPVPLSRVSASNDGPSFERSAALLLLLLSAVQSVRNIVILVVFFCSVFYRLQFCATKHAQDSSSAGNSGKLVLR